MQQSGSFPAGHQEDSIVDRTREVHILANVLQDVEGELGSDEVLPVIDCGLVDVVPDLVTSPLEYQLEHPAALLFLHVLRQEGSHLLEVLVGSVSPVFDWNF